MPLPLLALLLLSPLLASPSLADELRFSSGLEQTVMIELYTSEGCSSCPPAERQLNAYRQHPQLWSTFIPLAFHVDYWNYLGWQDRFSKPAFSERQRHYARLKKARTIYTPAFFVNGENPSLAKRISTSKPRPTGKLGVTIDRQGISAQFEPSQAQPGKAVLNIAILGMGLATEIAAGENEGRDARHEFVVLHHQQLTGQGPQWRTAWPAFDPQGAPQLALVAWVSLGTDPSPLQATGAYIPPGLTKP